MEIEILRTDLDVFEKQAALMSVTMLEKVGSHYTSIILELKEDGAPISAHTAWYLATNFQLEIRRLTLEKVLAS